MDEDLQQQIIKRLGELPADVRAAVESGDVPTHVHTIGQKHGLHVDQIGLLEDATMLVMLGFSNPGEFVGDITEQLHIPSTDAAVIAEEISQQLFVPIRESMQAFMEKRAASEPEGQINHEDLPAVIEPKHELPIPVVPTAPTLPTPGVGTPTASVGAAAPTMPAADTMLTQKTISAPTTQTPTPTSYKTDPYREPPE